MNDPGYYETRAEVNGRAIETDGGELVTVDAATADDLRDAIDALEAVEWSDVPNVTAPTAAVFTAMLRRSLRGETE